MRLLRTTLCSTALCALMAFPSSAGPTPPPTNILFGFVSANRTLTLAPPGPVYYVPGDLVIKPGVTLTVEPGVRIAFSTADTLGGGTDPSRVELVVQGQLEAVATLPDSIRFESVGGGTGEWYGLYSSGAGSIYLQDVALRGAVVALACGGSGPHSLQNVGISAVINGVLTLNSSCAIRDCRITGRGAAGGYTGQGLVVGPGAVLAYPDTTDARPTIVSGFSEGVRGNSLAVLQNLLVRENGAGIVSNSSPLTVNYCTVVNNVTGVNVFGNLFLNSIVAQNGGGGLFGPAIGLADYCDVWSNGLNLPGGNYGPNIASFNPFFVDPSSNDFRLSSGSIFKRYSNSGGEIGAYGPGAGQPVAARRTTWGRVKALYR